MGNNKKKGADTNLPTPQAMSQLSRLLLSYSKIMKSQYEKLVFTPKLFLRNLPRLVFLLLFFQPSLTCYRVYHQLINN